MINVLKECIYLLLSFWLGIIGAILALIGYAGKIAFKYIYKAGVWVVNYSFKFDLYL